MSNARPLSTQTAGLGDAEAVLARLRELRAAPRDAAFPARFVECVAALCRASTAVLIRMAETEEGVPAWQMLAAHGLDEADMESRLAWADDAAARCLERGYAQSSGPDTARVAVRVTGLDAPALLLMDISQRERGRLNELILRARLVADLAAPSAPAADGAPGDGDALVDVLEIVVDVMREARFGAAALALVNGLAAYLQCDLVALGWQDAGYVRATAISHLDRFERKTENVQMLEASFEEALDQRTDLRFPARDAELVVTLAHERFARALGYAAVQTLVLGRADAVGETDDGMACEAVLLLAGEGDAISASVLTRVSFALQLLMPWLDNLRSSDRHLGQRLLSWGRDAAGRFVGLEHVGRKVTAIVLGGLLLWVLLGTWPHRIEAGAELRTDSTRIISAPYESFLEDVLVTAGDEVTEGALLGELDVQDLYLQESEVRADMRRYDAEADRNRADGLMADVAIALARRAQAAARLERVLYLLDQARIRAPFSGVVVEGERSELLGRPVQQGDPLFRLARVEGLYAVVRVPERDIRFVDPAGHGELRLLSQPDRTIPFVIETLIPVAQVEGQSGNFFMLKVRLDESPQDWWRPGMAGMARIDAGRRNIAWLLTHRLLDTLRTRFWWW